MPAAAELTEKQFQAQVVETARMLGWTKIYHVFNSRRSHSGWPDLTLVRDRIVFIEVKTATGRLTEAQKDWLRALVAAGGEAYLARPDDLQELATVLAGKAGQAPGARSALLGRLEAELG